MDGYDRRLVRDTYSAIAEEYAATYADHLDRLDLDRELLDDVARQVDGRGRVLDVGCGPGHVGAYLAARGCRAAGVDPAAGMLALAATRHPDLDLVVGEMGRLPVRSGSCAGVVALYVLHHVPRAGLGAALGELRRALAPGGALLVATHAGTGEFRAAGAGGAEVVGTLYGDDELGNALAAAAFTVDAVRHRDPLPHERQADRVYVAATAA